MNVKYLIFAILVHFLLLFEQVVSDLDANIAVIEMAVAKHVHPCDESSNDFRISKDAVIFYFALFKVINVEAIRCPTALFLSFEEKYQFVGHSVIAELEYIVSYRVFSEHFIDFKI